MKEKRELKKSLQELVHELTELKGILLDVYKRYESMKETADKLVLEYMANVRKDDKGE